ncbi:class I SAM-dependent methyltransferase [Flagellimonas sp. 389]|uniref:class I SAM-dependent methyltransferase n=1 Tax=Flagellimonas sp. 389 TaxID=2835862 RepID=UPI001BD335A5|nr:class I SAM-dependent methyltransferase [Flagellimonas sp. 389]MBS9462321.1 class I SAM-dependent methyltransferase [Flagellimonas sp. 389]
MKTSKKAWPTKRVMEQVYEKKLWGDNGSHYYSGQGSHHPNVVAPYLKAVTSFLQSFEHPITVCDLGCGDFNIGKELVKHTKNYIAVDIVPDLVAYNKEQFREQNLEFSCLDIAKDELPSGDCAILRQVLQHLSNAEILNIVNKLYGFQYLLLTEHVPKGGFIPNKELISGQGIRLKKQSGVVLTATPFHLKMKEEKKLLSVDNIDYGGVIETVLYTLF